jgi:hypothetical protein
MSRYITSPKELPAGQNYVLVMYSEEYAQTRHPRLSITVARQRSKTVSELFLLDGCSRRFQGRLRNGGCFFDGLDPPPFVSRVTCLCRPERAPKPVWRSKLSIPGATMLCDLEKAQRLKLANCWRDRVAICAATKSS